VSEKQVGAGAGKLLEVVDATKRYPGRGGSDLAVVNNVSFSIDIDQPKIIAIAGESGSGKSTLGQLVLGLQPLTSGSILYRGRDISGLHGLDAHRFRREVQAVFQDPYGSFNPFYRVGHTFETVFRTFKLARNKDDKVEQVREALRVVSLRADEILHKFPHQLSGGQRQRIMMARAYLLSPSIIVADEPVSMVDASLRSMILQIMNRMKEERQISFLYITHDLATVGQVSDEIHLLYRGRVVESGLGTHVLRDAKHPYTQQLVESIPRVDRKWSGTVELPSESNDSPVGCPFMNRCPFAMDICRSIIPVLMPTPDPDHSTACWLHAPENERHVA